MIKASPYEKIILFFDYEAYLALVCPFCIALVVS